jgi:hypothetical protein
MVRKAATTDISNTIQFVLEIDKLKGVLRKVRLIGKIATRMLPSTVGRSTCSQCRWPAHLS